MCTKRTPSGTVEDPFPSLFEFTEHVIIPKFKHYGWNHFFYHNHSLKLPEYYIGSKNRPKLWLDVILGNQSRADRTIQDVWILEFRHTPFSLEIGYVVTNEICYSNAISIKYDDALAYAQDKQRA